MKKHVCPVCGNDKFHVTTHVTQTWVVDSEGDFVEEVTSCEEVTHRPDDEDIWHCTHCGWSGSGYDAQGGTKF